MKFATATAALILACTTTVLALPTSADPMHKLPTKEPVEFDETKFNFEIKHPGNGMSGMHAHGPLADAGVHLRKPVFEWRNQYGPMPEAAPEANPDAGVHLRKQVFEWRNQNGPMPEANPEANPEAKIHLRKPVFEWRNQYGPMPEAEME